MAGDLPVAQVAGHQDQPLSRIPEGSQSPGWSFELNIGLPVVLADGPGGSDGLHRDLRKVPERQPRDVPGLGGASGDAASQHILNGNTPPGSAERIGRVGREARHTLARSQRHPVDQAHGQP